MPTGWFIESIATQSLIIIVLRTRRILFYRSRPSLGLVLASLAVVTVGVWLPHSGVSGLLGFQPLPAPFVLALVVMVVPYLVSVEVAKSWFFSRPAQRGPTAAPPRTRGYTHRVHRRSSRFTERSASRSPGGWSIGPATDD